MIWALYGLPISGNDQPTFWRPEGASLPTYETIRSLLSVHPLVFATNMLGPSVRQIAALCLVWALSPSVNASTLSEDSVQSVTFEIENLSDYRFAVSGLGAISAAERQDLVHAPVDPSLIGSVAWGHEPFRQLDKGQFWQAVAALERFLNTGDRSRLDAISNAHVSTEVVNQVVAAIEERSRDGEDRPAPATEAPGMPEGHYFVHGSIRYVDQGRSNFDMPSSWTQIRVARLIEIVFPATFDITHGCSGRPVYFTKEPRRTAYIEDDKNTVILQKPAGGSVYRLRIDKDGNPSIEIAERSFPGRDIRRPADDASVQEWVSYIKHGLTALQGSRDDRDRFIIRHLFQDAVIQLSTPVQERMPFAQLVKRAVSAWLAFIDRSDFDKSLHWALYGLPTDPGQQPAFWVPEVLNSREYQAHRGGD